LTAPWAGAAVQIPPRPRKACVTVQIPPFRTLACYPPLMSGGPPAPLSWSGQPALGVSVAGRLVRRFGMSGRDGHLRGAPPQITAKLPHLPSLPKSSSPFHCAISPFASGATATMTSFGYPCRFEAQRKVGVGVPVPGDRRNRRRRAPRPAYHWVRLRPPKLKDQVVPAIGVRPGAGKDQGAGHLDVHAWGFP